jgi:hypothetical protein
MEKEVDNQILHDGFLWEHSLGYHKFVVELLSFAVILLERNGYSCPKIILNKLEKMYESLYAISMENGRIPLIGDEDQGQVITLDSKDYDDIVETLSVGHVLFNRDDFGQDAASELVFWLFNGRDQPKKFPSRRVPFFKVYTDSGYGVFKTENSFLLFCTSVQQKKYLHAGHRHLDMLSFIFEKNGEYFFVDPGTYTYFADDALRNKFRGISMHNTLTIDGTDPADLSGLFEIYPRVQANLRKYGNHNDSINYIWASHDGYKPLIHHRVIIQIPEGFTIYDHVQGDSKNHVFERYFHLHPAVTIKRHTEKELTLEKNNESLYVSSDEPIALVKSFFSPAYGVIKESQALKCVSHDGSIESFFSIFYTQVSQEDVDLNPKDFIEKIVKIP